MRALLALLLALLAWVSLTVEPRDRRIDPRQEGWVPWYDACERITLTAADGSTLRGTVCRHSRPTLGSGAALPVPTAGERKAE